MAKIYSLNLYQNAIDSLNVGMEIYAKALDDETKYKFSVIIISNFMELLLKCMVEMQNPLLCYEEPYSTKISNAKTITWAQALQILTNSGIVINKKLINDIKRLTELRNKIIHFKFEYDVFEIDAIILSVIDGLRQLYKNISGEDFNNDVQENTKLLLQKIEGEYLSQLHQAQFNAKEEADKNDTVTTDCPFCGESNTAVEREEEEIYCYFCDESDYEVECARCTEAFKISEMEYFGENEYGDPLYFCEYCSSLLDEGD
jgi:hypothetical protein